MATSSRGKEKEPVNVVHQNAIHIETIRKEQRSQKLYTEFTISPFTKIHVFTEKPMSRKTDEEAEEDSAYLKAIRGSSAEPTKKHIHPLTESQEIGWISTPLIAADRTDRRLNFPRQNSEITKYMNAAWSLKEQTENLR